SFQPDGRPIAYFDPDGNRLSQVAADAFAVDVHHFDGQLAQKIADSAPKTSYLPAVMAALSESGWDADRQQRVLEYLQHRTEEQYGVWIDNLDAHGLDDDQVVGDEVVFPEGYDALATRLAEGLDIRLNRVVTKIEWGGEGIRITAGEEVAATRAVVTLPVGVLKADVSIEPPLPEPVASALAGLAMNHFEKVFLTFPDRFWDEGLYAFRRQGDAGIWWHSWYDVTPENGRPTLLTFAAGPCAQAIRQWSEAQVARSVVDSLREIYPTTPDPVKVQVTHWQDDPYSRGSYAYMTVGSRPEDHDLLATPIGGVLHLAGEATWSDDPATVTAAFRSGHRAAENILRRSIPWTSVIGGDTRTDSSQEGPL
ncbi:MAG TPA: NAD(P)/FAD-dependent oxidoreductase, partial [Marmoricola sp.]|nr:NAD(P)/FAD-dependent oxidoreductase [Marmoricola sp.]